MNTSNIEGTMFYNRDLGCYDVFLGENRTYGGLHDGQVFEALITQLVNEDLISRWEDVRIEYLRDKDEWILVGEIDDWNDDVCMIGLPVRL